MASTTPGTALAYRNVAELINSPVPVTRPSPEVEVVSGAAPAGVSEADFTAAIGAAALALDLPCSTLRVRLSGAAIAPASAADGVTTVETVASGWEARGYGASQAAITELRYVRRGEFFEIADADIFLNDDTIDWAAAGAPDLRAIVHHELLHAVGLAHSCEREPLVGEPDCDEHPEIPAVSVMFPEYQPGAWAPREDDIAGVCALYPLDRCLGVDCASDEVCSEGSCVPAPVCASGMPCAYGACATATELAGECLPTGAHGTPCMVGNDCLSRLCLTSMRAGSYCTFVCADDAECTGMQRCTTVEGRQVCAPLPPGGGCAASRMSGERQAGPRAPLLVAVAVLLLVPLRSLTRNARSAPR